LSAEIVGRTDSEHLTEVLGSAWGTLLKPLAWWGVLCFDPPKGNRVTFVRADRLPKVPDAAPTVLRALLGAYGPATPELFDKVWLSRGSARKALLRSWFAALEDELAEVDVEGERRLMLAGQVEDWRPSRARPCGCWVPSTRISWAAGPTAAEIVPAVRRTEVGCPGGWLSPVVLHGGRAAGVWSEDGVTLGEDVPKPAIDAELSRHASLTALLACRGAVPLVLAGHIR
jgi:hypothetical protein